MSDSKSQFNNRELSWLSFNHRVLQEASDPTVPLFERIKFLAIFSSNLDEFFRVRVASVRALLALKKKKARQLDFDPIKLLKQINKTVTRQQEEFGEIFRNRIIGDLEREGIRLVGQDMLDERALSYAKSFFLETVLLHLEPSFLRRDKEPVFLENKRLYLCVELLRRGTDAPSSKPDYQYAILHVPTHVHPRFIELPGSEGGHDIMFLDDLIRLNLSYVFPNHDVLGAYAIKMTRDAELYIDDEFSGDLVQKIKKALQKRSTGLPSRFLYDASMPAHIRKLLQKQYSLEDDDMIEGARYHNFSDLFSFPNPKAPQLTYESLEPIHCVPPGTRLLEEIAEQDILLYYPSHSYDSVIQFLADAADDHRVSSIKITLYRVARKSRVVEQLLRAVRNGKEVVVFVELKARFDEESNLYWAEELEKAGAMVFYSFPGLKVHAKLCLVTMESAGITTRLAYLSTGNFNEQAARMYTDFGLLTADPRLTDEVTLVFDILSRKARHGTFEHLLVAPFTLRKSLSKLIDREIKNARNGEPASIIAKMNSLEDREMIEKLYDASTEGVRIQLIVRGICCLIPAKKGLSENIEVVSIVDRYLEHARVFIFHNGGNPRYYLSSADWMRRNLSQRIEVAFPIYNQRLQKQIRSVIDIQLSDNVKSRLVNAAADDQFKQRDTQRSIRSQYAIHEYFTSGNGRVR